MGPPATALALSYAALSGGSGQRSSQVAASKPSAAGAAPQAAVRSRLVVHAEALVPSEDAHGWTVLATTMRPEAYMDTEILQAYQEQYVTMEPGLR